MSDPRLKDTLLANQGAHQVLPRCFNSRVLKMELNWSTPLLERGTSPPFLAPASPALQPFLAPLLSLSNHWSNTRWPQQMVTTISHIEEILLFYFSFLPFCPSKKFRRIKTANMQKIPCPGSIACSPDPGGPDPCGQSSQLAAASIQQPTDDQKHFFAILKMTTCPY